MFQIKRLEVRNFKSFDHLEIELGNFNLLIGANASGKSNFVQILRFLKDITLYSLTDAISLSGGEYLLNRNIGRSEDFFLKIILGGHKVPAIILEQLIKPFKGEENGEAEIIYEFGLRFIDEGDEFEITRESLTLRLMLTSEERPDDSEKEIKIRYFREDNEMKREIQKLEGIEIVYEDELIPRIPKIEKVPQKELFLCHRSFYFTATFWGMFLPFPAPVHLGVYNFDPKLSKKPISPMEARRLREDGSNLALVMREILRDPQERKRFLRLVRYALPFIEEVDVARFLDQSLVFTLKENYSKESMPGFFVSDGTAHILALILALYFGERNIVIIEEPERNIHPSLIYKIVEMMKDASRYKQIIATTHNPEMVRHAGIEPLLLFYRDKNGFSKVKRPADKEDIRKFLEETMGLEELYVQNLLEVF